MTDGLDVIAPQGRSVAYGGQRLEVRPLTVGQLPPLVRTCRPVVDALLALDAIPGVSADADLTDEQSSQMVDILLGLVENHGEAVYEAAALAIGAPVDVIAAGTLDEFLELGMAVMEVNRDFFVRRLGPHLAGLKGRTSGAGPTSSSSSSDTDTP